MLTLKACARLAARSVEIRSNGVYVGLLEWAAFAAVDHVRVEMAFGDDIVNVVGVFVSALLPERLSSA